MRRVLFDSDVLLDVLAQRQPFVVASAQALNRVIQPQVQGYLSGHAVTNIFYILRRQVGSETARELVSRLLQHLQIASVIDLMAFEDGIHLNKEVQRWFHWYNQERPHQALKYRTSQLIYWETRSLSKEA